MSFSELSLLSEPLGLEWREESYLSGTVKKYPVCIYDDKKNREYIVTLFCRYKSEAEALLKEGITGLTENLPKNCVLGRKSELNYQQLTLNAGMLYQENSFYLAELVNGLCGLAENLGLTPTEFVPEIVLNNTESINSQKKSENGKHGVNSSKTVSKHFDKHSVRGLIGAVIGAAAMAVIGGSIIDTRPSNIGGMIASWVTGALIAAVTVADYRFLAKKIDMFGTVACSVLTLAACGFSSVYGGIRMLKRYASILFPEITLGDTVRNFAYYQIIFPEPSEEFPLMVIKNLLSALAASVIFYTLYFRSHSDIMYAEGEERINENKG